MPDPTPPPPRRLRTDTALWGAFQSTNRLILTMTIAPAAHVSLDLSDPDVRAWLRRHLDHADGRA